MKKTLTSLFCLLGISIITATNALPNSNSLVQSEQLVVVTAKNWDSTKARLQLFQRVKNKNANSTKSWQKIGPAIEVVVGKNGLAWGVPLKNNISGPIKKEGDNRAPAGIFSFGDGFGFAEKAPKNMKMNYMPITDDTVCVDDIHSKYYNQIIHSAQVEKSSWNSGEKMQTVPGYYWGAVVNYNTQNPTRGAGSCIFMHIWKGNGQGTAGCVAMPKTALEKILAWLDPNKKPLLIILPEKVYQQEIILPRAT